MTLSLMDSFVMLFFIGCVLPNLYMIKPFATLKKTHVKDTFLYMELCQLLKYKYVEVSIMPRAVYPLIASLGMISGLPQYLFVLKVYIFILK